ncbi:MAG TPA: hypothetical protein VJ652_09170, partial [Noviherbaspirillum sp.]|nr:hypothetical protein [Noviherbaspirillum sp.]
MDTATILLSSFVLSITGLFFFIWSLRKKLFDNNPAAAHVIFSPGEVGRIEEPAADAAQRAGLQDATTTRLPVLDAAQEANLSKELTERIEADKSTAFVAFVFLACAVVWLIVASSAGLISSIKLHEPDWLVNQAWLTFGRIRTIHLNAVAYG